MSANDVLALEANFNSWKAARLPAGTSLSVDPFEYYCVDQFLKQFPVSDEEVLDGITGGGQDGGVDAFYFFVNRKLVQEDTDVDAKAALRVNLLIFQVKQSSGFSPSQIDKLFFFTDDLLDLSRVPNSYHTAYNTKVSDAIKLFKEKYSLVAGSFPEVFIDYFYVTKADVSPNDDAKTSAAKTTGKATEHLGKAHCNFTFVNASALWTQVQMRPPTSKPLAWQDTPLQVQEGWIGLVALGDYYNFLQDENGDLNERIFESNVRGFQQSTSVNIGIAATLKTPGEADFWLLNNGITILAARAGQAGYKRLDIEDPQIVNGLQTSRQIFDYFHAAPALPNPDSRRILVRVIQTSDESVRDDVIRATNSQNKMPAEALRITDRIHAQIDALFRQYGFFYDRRKGHYRDEGKPITQIVSVTELLQAMLAVVLKRPDDARARPRDYIQDDGKYAAVFGEDRYDLTVYLKVVLLLRRVSAYLSTQIIDLVHKRNLKFYLAMYIASAATKHPYAPPDELLRLDPTALSDELVKDCYDRLWKQYDYLGQIQGEDWDAVAKGATLLKRIQTELKRRFTPRKKRTDKSA